MTSSTTKSSAQPLTEPSSGVVDFILHRLRVAELRAKITTNQIEAAAVALSAGMISAEQAISMLTETGLEISSS